MKKLVSFVLCISMLISMLAGCGNQNNTVNLSENNDSEVKQESENEANISSAESEDEKKGDALKDEYNFEWEPDIKYTGMSDDALLDYIEESVYSQLINELGSAEYYVEGVEAVYISEEYIQELAYNSQTNIFFGFSLAELDEYFSGTRYVFALDDDGKTTVEALQTVEDVTYEKMLKNVAIGTGVILVCVTVSALSAGTGAAAVSMIFSVAAKTGATCALSGALISGVSSAVVRGYQTGDLSEALKAGALSASEGYKWGAISGALVGGAGEAWGLYGATGNGLTMNQVAQIQQESGYPLEIIKQFHSVEEYNVFREASLKAEMLADKLALVRSDIDLYNVVDEYGRNNFMRLKEGLNPIDASGKPFEWHHIGQNNDATLALLTSSEHDAGSLHGFKVTSEIDRAAFEKYKKDVLNPALLKYLLSCAG